MAQVTLEAYQAVERRVAREQGRVGFWWHAGVTAVVSLVLVILNVTVANEFPWSVFAIAGMGLGLVLHWYFGVVKAEMLMRRHQEEVERKARA